MVKNRQLRIKAASVTGVDLKAEHKGVGLSQLLTEVLKRDIEINEALK